MNIENKLFSKQWDRKGFLKVLENLLNKFSKISSSNIKKILQHDDMFQMAFTCPSYNPNSNYEFLEFVGDMYINLIFTKYAISKLNVDEMNPEISTLIKQFVQKKEFLVTIMRKYDLERFMLFTPSDNSPKPTLKDISDVLEAFSYALIVVINKEFKKDIGGVVLETFYDSLLDDILGKDALTIIRSFSIKPINTYAKELFEGRRDGYILLGFERKTFITEEVEHFTKNNEGEEIRIKKYINSVSIVYNESMKSGIFRDKRDKEMDDEKIRFEGIESYKKETSVLGAVEKLLDYLAKDKTYKYMKGETREEKKLNSEKIKKYLKDYERNKNFILL